MTSMTFFALQDRLKRKTLRNLPLEANLQPQWHLPWPWESLHHRAEAEPVKHFCNVVGTLSVMAQVGDLGGRISGHFL